MKLSLNFKQSAVLAACAMSLLFCGANAFAAKKSADEGNALVSKMKIGWNLGNTLDAWADGQNNGLDSETCWGQPKTTAEMFQGLAKSGIGSVRIPITWHNHLIDNNYTIDPAWMARTKEVVDMALNAGLYVIINVHHDTAPSANVKYGQGYYPVESAKTESLKFLNRVWEQIAAAYKNYDERIVFELLNEPRLVGHEREWWYDDAVADCGKANKIIVEYEQACLDKIRKSGGNNKDRFILVPAYVAQPWAAMKDTFALPKDKAKGRIMLSVHMYDPWSFAGDPAGEAEFTQAAKDGLLNAFGALYDNFVKKGVPVVITECGATNKNNLSAREAWFKFYFENAKKKGITAVLWDNGVYEVTKDGDFGEHFGFYNRTEQKWYFPTLLKAALEGVKAGESR